MKVLFLLLILATTSTVFASGRAGNGGDGWLDPNGKPYLYDLKEGNLHKNPYFKNVEVDQDVRQRVFSVLDFMSESSGVLLAKKISEIKEIYPSFAEAILAGIELYQWNLSDKILDIKDEDPILDIPSNRQVQLAGRKEQDIYIDINLWNRLDAKNSAALIIHEIIYAWITPSTIKKIADENNRVITYERQQSIYARSIVRYLFSKNFDMRGIEAFKKFASGQNLPDFYKNLRYKNSQFRRFSSYTYNADYILLIDQENHWGPDFSKHLPGNDRSGESWNKSERRNDFAKYCKRRLAWGGDQYARDDFEMKLLEFPTQISYAKFTSLAGYESSYLKLSHLKLKRRHFGHYKDIGAGSMPDNCLPEAFVELVGKILK